MEITILASFYRKLFFKKVGEPEQEPEATWVTGTFSCSPCRFGHNRKGVRKGIEGKKEGVS